jgi:hypothetical protein
MKRRPKKRHHYVPRFYLSGFIDPANPPYVWVYEKGNPTIKNLTVENTAVQKHYYSMKRETGEIDSESAEDAFAQIESRVAPLFRKVQQHQGLDEEGRKVLSAFLGLLLVRVPNFRHNVEHAFGELAKRIFKTLASNRAHLAARIQRYERQTGRRVTMPLERLRQFALSDKYSFKVNPVVSLAMMEKFDQMGRLFCAMNWAFLVAPQGAPFLTSDNPVTYVDPTHDPRSFRGVGLAGKNIEVSVPLSRDVALVAMWKPIKEEFVQAPCHIVAEINRRLAIGAERFVYASQKSDALNTMVQEFRDGAPRMTVI